MTPPADRKESVFTAAAALPTPERRAALLDQECAGDPALRQRVEALLRAHDRQGHFIDQARADDPNRTLSHDVAKRPQSGLTIAGRYKLLEEIGEGGMGAVWVAEQSEPVRRRVALKLIKPGMDSRQVLARFEAERQALALMDHPNIAKVFDGGMTDEGRPFFVMEYVKGLPITEYCDESRLTIAERLGLFTQVCHAVQHAHQKGIIHRDLKPSNILVCLYDGVPVPKVIDFGLAKAMHQSLTERTLFTAHGMMVGTPLYMSPEQAEFNNLDIDTRTDVYSLGVILYELLTGTTPLERKRFQEAAWHEMLRLIKEEEPVRPSARLSSTDTLASVAASRQSEPARLTKLVRGELDWIVLKALEKDRRRRYDTATDLAADVQHHVADEPVRACPPSAVYRFGKFARRNKLALATAATLTAALAAAVVVLAVSNVWVRRERDQKEQALREKTAALAEAMESAQQARRAVDEMLTAVGERTLSDVPQMAEVQKTLLEKALSFQNEFLSRWGDKPELRHEVAKAHRRVAQINEKLGQRDNAAQATHKALEIEEALVREFPDNAEYRQELSTTYIYMATAGENYVKRSETEKWYRKALELREQLVAENPRNPAYRQLLIGVYDDLRRVHKVTQRYAEAEAFANRAVEVARQLAADFPADLKYVRSLAAVTNNLGDLYSLQGKHEEAARCLREVLAAAQKIQRDPQSRYRDRGLLALAYLGLGEEQWRLGQRQTGEQSYRQGLTLFEKLAAEFPGEAGSFSIVGNAWRTLGNLLHQDKRLDDAEEAYRRSLAVGERSASDFGDIHSNYYGVIDVLIDLTKLLEERGRADEAAKVLTETTARIWRPVTPAHARPETPSAVYKATNGQAHFIKGVFERYFEVTGDPRPRLPDLKDDGGPYLKAGLLLAAGGHYLPAVQALRRCNEIAPNNASGHDRLARLLANCPQVELRDPAAAVELSQRATEIVPNEASFWTTRGLAHYRAGQWQPAVQALEESMKLNAGGDGLDWIVLAMAHHQLGHHDEVGKWWDKAHVFEMQGPKNDEAQRLLAEAAALLKREVGRPNS